LCKAIFSSKGPNGTVKFSHTELEEKIKGVIQHSGLDANAPLENINANACKTFVIATSLKAATGAIRMRSYGTPMDDAFPASIWEAARATTAAPTFFLPNRINNTSYGDGGVGWNNPREEAISEPHNT
jgi:predicted acylesterase/phospholipase RssA